MGCQVLRGSGLHLVDVTNPDGSLVSRAEIRGALEHIMTCEAPENPPLAVLTTMERDEWATTRSTLAASSPVNAESLRQVDGALFAVTLEDVQPTDDVETFRTMLFGRGHNRWFDKSFSFVFTPKGQVALNFEHAWGDGVAVLRLCNEVRACACVCACACLCEGVLRIERERHLALKVAHSVLRRPFKGAEANGGARCTRCCWLAGWLAGFSHFVVASTVHIHIGCLWDVCSCMYACMYRYVPVCTGMYVCTYLPTDRVLIIRLGCCD